MTSRPAGWSAATPGSAGTHLAAIEPRQQGRTLVVLVIAQTFSGAGLAAGITVGALLAQDMLGATSLAGCPARCSPSVRPRRP